MNTLLAILGSSFLVGSSSLTALNQETTAKKIINLKDTNQNLLIGYWHNWDNATGYQGGNARYMDLTEVSDVYDVINVSFMKVMPGHGTIPTFIPEVPNHPDYTQAQKDAYFQAQVSAMHQKGKKIVLSLGGADAHIVLTAAQQPALIAEILRLVNDFGIDGIDIDLEQEAIGAGDNLSVITSALKSVKTTLAAQNREFIISMAPEFAYLRTNAIAQNYVQYLSALEGYYDYISPQFYNQAGDGVNIQQADREELGLDLWWLPQNNQALKPEFLYLIAKYITQGTDNFYQIAADKLAWGLPANIDAAANGQVGQNDVKKASAYLSAKNIHLKGMMT